MEKIPPYRSFVRGIHQSPMKSPHKGQWRGALVFSLIFAWTKDYANNRDAGDLRPQSLPLWRRCKVYDGWQCGLPGPGPYFQSLKWRHNGRHAPFNHRGLDCLLNRLFRRTWKKTSKLRVIIFCEGNPPKTGGFPHKEPVTREMTRE